MQITDERKKKIQAQFEPLLEDHRKQKPDPATVGDDGIEYVAELIGGAAGIYQGQEFAQLLDIDDEDLNDPESEYYTETFVDWTDAVSDALPERYFISWSEGGGDLFLMYLRFDPDTCECPGPSYCRIGRAEKKRDQAPCKYWNGTDDEAACDWLVQENGDDPRGGYDRE